MRFQTCPALPQRGDLLLQLPRSYCARTSFGLIHGVHLLQVSVEPLLTRSQLAPQLPFGEIPVPVVHRLDPRPVRRDRLPPEQLQAPTDLHEVSEHLPERSPVVAPEIRDRLEIRAQAS